jgi:hypothetical protein
MWRPLKLGFALLSMLTACGGSSDTLGGSDRPETQPTATTEATSTASSTAEEELYPDVIDVEVTSSPDGTWAFAVTIRSPYDSPDRYADAWRVLGPDGEEYGRRILTHDHAGEQPFTRSVSGVEIPDAVTEVTVQGRDLLSGWGGATVLVDLNR